MRPKRNPSSQFPEAMTRLVTFGGKWRKTHVHRPLRDWHVVTRMDEDPDGNRHTTILRRCRCGATRETHVNSGPKVKLTVSDGPWVLP